MAEIPQVDAILANADWTKQKLDVWIRDGAISRLVRNVEELASVLHMTVDDVKKLPVYKGALTHWKAKREEFDTT